MAKMVVTNSMRPAKKKNSIAWMHGYQKTYYYVRAHTHTHTHTHTIIRQAKEALTLLSNKLDSATLITIRFPKATVSSHIA